MQTAALAVNRNPAHHAHPPVVLVQSRPGALGFRAVSAVGGVSPPVGHHADLVSLLYRSRATMEFNPTLLDHLVSGARVRNHERDVTGALYFEGGQFMQWLEGPAPTVSRLFGKIGEDRRHTDVEVLSFGHTTQRVFADWNLRLYHGFAELPRVGFASSKLSLPGVADDPVLLRELALALARGRVGELAIAFEQAGSDLRQQAMLCERLMRQYGELWARDECTEVDTVLGLALAQSQFRLHRARFPAHALAGAGETVLVMPAPGERHTLGASLAQASLEEGGYGVPSGLAETTDDMLQQLDACFCNHAVIASSGVFPRTHRVNGIRACADLLREVLPRGASIGLYGQIAAVEPSVVAACGCDFGAHSAVGLPDRIKPPDGKRHWA